MSIATSYVACMHLEFKIAAYQECYQIVLSRLHAVSYLLCAMECTICMDTDISTTFQTSL